MGRRKVPITWNGPVAQLALALTGLRDSSGMTLRELADRVGYSHSTLASAERGRILPSWAVTEAFVDGCGASAADWRPLWAAALAGRDQQPTGSTEVTAAACVPAQSPGGVPGFTGRRHELAQLSALAEPGLCGTGNPPLICIIDGMAGVGKSALAIEFANSVRQFSDGQLFVNAQGYGLAGEPLAPRDVLIQLMRGINQAFTPPAMSTEELAGAYRSAITGKSILIILDNVRSAEQVRMAIPGRGPGLLIVTSRNRLNGLAVREGAFQLALSGLPEQDSIALLSRIVGQRIADADPCTVQKLVHLCGHLPLALRIAGHHLTAGRYRSVADLAAALASVAECLDVLAVHGDETASVRSILSSSYRSLDAEVAGAFRCIGQRFSGEFDSSQAADLLGSIPADVRLLLRSLVNVSMLQELSGDRYAFHRLVGLYAAERARAEGHGADYRITRGVTKAT